MTVICQVLLNPVSPSLTADSFKGGHLMYLLVITRSPLTQPTIVYNEPMRRENGARELLALHITPIAPFFYIVQKQGMHGRKWT